MNTKIFIISIALILLFPKSVSVGASSQKQAIPIQNETEINSQANNKHNDKALDWTFDWSYTDGVHHNSHPDDDNKSHHFHYDRLSRNRRRVLLSILVKILLFITHISSLLFATIHLLH